MRLVIECKYRSIPIGGIPIGGIPIGGILITLPYPCIHFFLSSACIQEMTTTCCLSAATYKADALELREGRGEGTGKGVGGGANGIQKGKNTYRSVLYSHTLFTYFKHITYKYICTYTYIYR